MLAPAGRLHIQRLVPALMMLALLVVGLPLVLIEITLEANISYIFFMCLGLPVGAFFFAYRGVYRDGVRRWGLVGSMPLITGRGRAMIKRYKNRYVDLFNPESLESGTHREAALSLGIFGATVVSGWGHEQDAYAMFMEPKGGGAGGGCGGCGDGGCGGCGG